ncbi:hypothetical protein CFOL_v3_12398 [Cephalotus follicularis]|uniref:DUF2470 domain-containing protein n=1 Tax=Cephalotus follicularis TaxID=3775 RepID=A0A1Q3BLP1_CEPFO|nr:hypothetical protein CFOL_v3_12398 [Cephalotus follicularis]
MKGTKATVLTLAEKCKNILASNWQGTLHTIKADAKGSKEDIYTSKVKYILLGGKPYIWVPEKEMHNVNIIVDERSSFSVASPFPAPLASLLKSISKLPARVSLTGNTETLKSEKVQLATESLKEVIQCERSGFSKFSYTVSSVLSSNHILTSWCENLKELLDGTEKYVVYKFNLRSCMFIDGYGGPYEVDLKDIEKSKADLLAPFSAKLIDGINQSEARRRALVLFCFVYLNANAKDAYMLSVDRKGFVVLAKISDSVIKDGISEYQWKELRFTFHEDALDVENFCRLLVEMEEEAIQKVSSYSGLA